MILSQTKRTLPQLIGILCLPLLISCGGGSDSTSLDNSRLDDYERYMTSIGITDPVQIELSDDTDAAMIQGPSGEDYIVDDRLIVDFVNSMSMDDIDGTLASYGMHRLGTITGFNIVTVGLPPGGNEQEYLSILDALPTVSAVSYEYELQDYAVSGANIGVDVSDVAYPNEDTALDAHLRVNWPHYIMDTFPAHALIELLQSTESLEESVVAVMEKSSFHSQSADTGIQASVGSILSEESIDTDLAGKVVHPTVIVSDRLNQSNFINSFAVNSSNNSQLYINDDQYHALEVSSAAVGSGEHILGTGKHAKLMPVLLTRTRAEGVCLLDRTRSCAATSDCMKLNLGSCDKGWSTTQTFAAVVADFGRRLNTMPNGDAVKVINMSIGFGLNSLWAADNVRTLFKEPLDALLSNQRVLVVAAGNKGRNVDFSFPGTLAAPRDDVSIDNAESQIVVVSGSAQAERKNNAFNFNRNETNYLDSNVGSRIHVSAPAVIVPVLDKDLESTNLVSGTSFASPYVAGAIAELFSIDPELSASEAIDIVTMTADDLGDEGPDDTYGYGRINLWKAVLTVLNRHSDATAPEWTGLRFRVNAPIELAGSIDPNVVAFVNNTRVDNSRARETLFFPENKDNATSLVSRGFTPNATTFEISLHRDEFNILGQFAVVSLEAFEDSPSGVRLNTQLQIPLRMKELRESAVFTSSHDDYVATIDIGAELAEQRGFIFGRVRDDSDQPIEGAVIRYNAFDDTLDTTLSDADGLFVAYDVFADPDYINTVQISADGYELFETTIDIAPLTSAGMDVTLDKIQDVENNGQQGPADIPDPSFSIAINVNEGRCGRNVLAGEAADFSNPDNYEFTEFANFNELVSYVCEYNPGTSVCGYTKQEGDVQLSISGGYLHDVANRECSA